MQIQNMFEHDINRNINGVVKVGDVDENLVEQELKEYVVAKELQGHFSTFYRNYERSLDTPTSKTGVWISGFFGSGKSHFLKMLSYLLSNPEVKGRRAVDYFKGKIDDEMVYARMKRVAAVPTETILFNVDSRGGKWKEGETAKTALMRSFQRVFYENQGFYGEDLKLAKLEAFIDSKGKTQEFREAFEDVSDLGWLENRGGWSFYEDDMVETLTRALGMSRDAAQHWFDGTETDVVSSDTFSRQVKAYIDKKKAEFGSFRLVFLADEIGQFIGSDNSLTLDMQTMIEDLGTQCGGDVWVLVTSQQAIDSVTDIVGMDFSKIQGRFDTRLSLSSSDVDEIIKERVLAKTDEATALLETEYQKQATVLKNLFSFDDSTSDLFGYAGTRDYVESYPFVGYQFRILPDVFTKTREHGFSGKHMSSGERSMISAFQESVQRVQEEQPGVLVPFWRFYDTIETSLDYGIRQVINRCQDAADEEHGLFEYDVWLIKALYLIRYIGDITPNVNNIANLMIDSVDVDKIALRKQVLESLERLVRENKVARNGDKYNFLTSEEQDVADEISKVEIDASEVTDKIKRILFDSIYTTTKHRVGQNDFPFDRYVDDSVHGKDQGGMKLNTITYAHEWSRLSEPEFALKSTGQALVGLEEGDYYDLLDMSCRVEKYVRMSTTSQWSPSKQDIVKRKREEARENEKAAKKSLEDAIVCGRLAVDGRGVTVKEQAAGKRLDAILDDLVTSTYTKTDYIDLPANTDSDLFAMYRGEAGNQIDMDGHEPNWRAMDEVMSYLDAQAYTHQATNMGDLQRKYQKAPYGWREIDVAAVMVQLLNRQRIAMSVGGKRLDSGDTHAIMQHLRKDADKAQVEKREAIEAATLASVQRLMKDFADTNQVPGDEDGLVVFAKDHLKNASDKCQEMLAKWYSHKPYPGKQIVADGRKFIESLLVNAVDPVLFCKSLSNRQTNDSLLDLGENLEKIRGFFATQARLYDDSRRLTESLVTEGIYIEGSSEAQAAIAQIRGILAMDEPYGRIKDLGVLNSTVTRELSAAAGVKRDDLLRSIDDAVEQIKRYADEECEECESAANLVVSQVEQAAIVKRDAAHGTESCSQLDAQVSQLVTWTSQQYAKIDSAIADARRKKEEGRGGKTPPMPKPKTAVLHRSRVCPTKTMHTEGEVDEYVQSLKNTLMSALEDNDAVRLGD
ncbi:BREX system P-loop protein BrxC [Gordonibacter sp.]|uniref:BREX system P-loop protein BrxC n=1 Tax=Gordonibacter sp. TaxID=1968902 RepID=UPI002FC91AE8